jgi:O-acetylserine/cysteine efflux transporter
VVVVPAVFLVGPPRVSWRWVVPIGLTLGAGQFGLVFTSMHLGMPAGLSSLVLQAQAAFTLVFAAALLREVVHIRQVFGLTLAFTGVVLVGSDLDQTAPPLAFALCLGGAAMWGLGNVVMRKARPPDVFNVMVWAGVVAVVPLFALSMLIEGPHTAVAALAELTPAGVGALAYVAYLATLFGYQVWGTLLGHYRASVVAPYSLLVPVVGMSSAALLLDERFGMVQLAAGVLIVAGVALNGTRRSRRRPDSSTLGSDHVPRELRTRRPEFKAPRSE